MGELQCDPAGFKDRIVSMSLYGMRVETKNYVKIIQKVEEYARRFPRSHWSFLGPGSEKKWHAK